MAAQKTRREFFTEFSSLLLSFLPFGALLSGCATTGLAYYRVEMKKGVVTILPQQFPELALEGGAVQLEVENYLEPVIVVRLNKESYLALSPICTHLGCTVRKEPSFFRCPCHGSAYALDGSVVRGPAKQRLSLYRMEREGENFLIYL